MKRRVRFARSVLHQAPPLTRLSPSARANTAAPTALCGAVERELELNRALSPTTNFAHGCPPTLLLIRALTLPSHFILDKAARI
jgi:hypothetical protein